MAFTVTVSIDEEFETPASIDAVFDVLADVPESVSHFPKVDELKDLGDGKYQWEMEKIGLQKWHLQTVYACKYVSDRDKGVVKWTPVKKVGNAQVSGKWQLKDLDGAGTLVKLKTTADLDMPFPALTKLALGPIVRGEFEGMIATYLENLQETFEKAAKKGKKASKGKKKK